MARLLVVDDVKFISQMIAAVFERMGHVVDTAADGVEALEKAFAVVPDLVIMDVAMPRLDGLEVTRRLRADERTRDLPILLVTSKNDVGTLTEAAQAGVDDHLPKPFETSALVSKSSRLLGGYPMTFAIERFGATGIVLALPEELAAPAAEHVKQAMERARAAGAGPLLLDLTRVARIDPSVGEALLAFAAATRAAGAIEIVRPRPGIGVRAFLGQVSARLKIHESVGAARAAFGVAADAAGEPVRVKRAPRPVAAPPVAAPPPEAAPPLEAARAPASAAEPAHAHPSTVVGAARGVVVETHPQATIFRVHRPELDEDVLALLGDEVTRAPRSVLLDAGLVVDVGEREVAEIAELVRKASAAGGSLRVVNPPAVVADRLTAAGLGAIVLWTRQRPAATRPSS
jgi:CheY-like chemotaxis protein